RRGGGTLVASRQLARNPFPRANVARVRKRHAPVRTSAAPAGTREKALKSLSRETARRPCGRSAAMAPYLPSLRTRRSEPRSGRDHHLCDPSAIRGTRMAAAAHAPAKPRLLPATSAFADCLRDPQLQN